MSKLNTQEEAEKQAVVMSGFYTDGIDHSGLKINSEQFPEHEECVMCGSTSVTVTDDKDICHDCGYVYE